MKEFNLASEVFGRDKYPEYFRLVAAKLKHHTKPEEGRDESYDRIYHGIFDKETYSELLEQIKAPLYGYSFSDPTKLRIGTSCVHKDKENKDLKDILLSINFRDDTTMHPFTFVLPDNEFRTLSVETQKLLNIFEILVREVRGN